MSLTLDQILKFQIESNNRFIVFEANTLIALCRKDPNILPLFQELVALYALERSNEKSNRSVQLTDSSGVSATVPVMKGETLEVDELYGLILQCDRAIDALQNL